MNDNNVGVVIVRNPKFKIKCWKKRGERIMDIVDLIEKYVKEEIEIYKQKSEDNYDFWNEHIKYVYLESTKLARQYGADLEIVKLGALLHDIALIRKVGDKKDHHINGKMLAQEILKSYDYPEEKANRVLSCVYNHRSGKNTANLEDLCVADADIIAHFDSIPMLVNLAYNRFHIGINEVRDWMKKCFEDDYEDLSDRTKESFKEKYRVICDIVLGE